MRTPLFLTLFCICVTSAAQNLSFGVVVGTAITNDFRTLVEPGGFFGTDPNPGDRTIVGGPTIEWRFRPNWSLEADGIFRELETGSGVGPIKVVTWEFPVLTKYTFWNGRRIRPFIDGGVSFRAAGNLNGTHPRHVGATAGAGVDLIARGWSIAPQLRYTHWQSDIGPTFAGQTLPNQLEFLVGFTRTSASNLRPMGRRFSIGAVFGTNLTSLFPDSNVQGQEFFVNPDGSTTTVSLNETTHQLHSLIGGIMMEAHLPGSFSVEGDALYAPPHVAFKVSSGGRSSSGVGASSLWEFPVLAKYRFPGFQLAKSGWRPFLALGASFRLDTELAVEPHEGVAAGAGLETRWRGLKIAPTVRYTRWRKSSNPFSTVNDNQVEFLTGFSF